MCARLAPERGSGRRGAPARGGRPGYGARAPRSGACSRSVFKSGLDWDLLGEPEPGLGGRRLYLPRGRVIGGSSSINAMIYLRGNRADFDEWAALGCDGLVVRRRPAVLHALRGQRARRGRVSRRRRPAARSATTGSMHPLVDTMLEAAVQAGYEPNPGPERRAARQEWAVPAHAARAAGGAARPTRSCTPRWRPEPRGDQQRIRPSASSSRARAPSASSSSATAFARPCGPSAR